MDNDSQGSFSSLSDVLEKYSSSLEIFETESNCTEKYSSSLELIDIEPDIIEIQSFANDIGPESDLNEKEPFLEKLEHYSYLEPAIETITKIQSPAEHLVLLESAVAEDKQELMRKNAQVVGEIKPDFEQETVLEMKSELEPYTNLEPVLETKPHITKIQSSAEDLDPTESAVTKDEQELMRKNAQVVGELKLEFERGTALEIKSDNSVIQTSIGDLLPVTNKEIPQVLREQTKNKSSNNLFEENVAAFESNLLLSDPFQEEIVENETNVIPIKMIEAQPTVDSSIHSEGTELIVANDHKNRTVTNLIEISDESQEPVQPLEVQLKPDELNENTLALNMAQNILLVNNSSVNGIKIADLSNQSIKTFKENPNKSLSLENIKNESTKKEVPNENIRPQVGSIRSHSLWKKLSSEEPAKFIRRTSYPCISEKDETMKEESRNAPRTSNYVLKMAHCFDKIKGKGEKVNPTAIWRASEVARRAILAKADNSHAKELKETNDE